MRRKIDIIILGNPIKGSKYLRKLKKLPYSFLAGDSQTFTFPKGYYVSRGYSHFIFYIDLIQASLVEPCKVRLNIKESSLYFLLVLKGSISFSNPGFQISKGECVLTFSKVNTFIGSLARGITCILYVGIRTEWLIKHRETLKELNKLLEISSETIKHTGIRTYNEKMRLAIKKLLQLDSKDPVLMEKEITGICMKLLLEYQIELSANPVSWKSDQTVVNEIQQYLENNFRHVEAGRIALLAQRFNKSTRTLMRIFPRYSGKKIHEYLLEIRLKNASELLSISKLSVTGVAKKTGFRSVNHFSRAFKKRFGTSPLKYRKNS